MISINAYAKINLSLEILGKRPDGYHEVVTVMQTVSLHDTLTLEAAPEISLECDRPDLGDESNLAIKAARLLRERASHPGGALIRLEKRIPVAAGLGGGSSDAAAALKGLNTLWGLRLSEDELRAIGAELGSDVPFFIHGGTAMAQGRGERIRPLPPISLEWFVILCPKIELPNKTAALYRRITPADYTPGHLTRKLEARIRDHHGDVPPQLLYNAFDGVAKEAFPGLKEYWDAFYALGAREIHLAGAGPSLFAPVSRKELGTALQLMLKHRHGWEAHLVSAWRPEGTR